MNNKSYNQCIVHYNNQSSYSTLKLVSKTNKQRIFEAKEKREHFGGSNLHIEQINQIPAEIQVNCHHVHLEPCYKRFVFPYVCMIVLILCMEMKIAMKNVFLLTIGVCSSAKPAHLNNTTHDHVITIHGHVITSCNC